MRLQNGEITGIKEWEKSIELSCDLDVDGVTIHVPRASIGDMLTDSYIWHAFLEIMASGIRRLPKKAKAGIENIHMPIGGQNTIDREFGCLPEECLLWISALNGKLGYERVGSVLDVGHATNNSVFSSRYTRSIWYEMMGSKTVAYHIHQVKPTKDGLKNHYAIENWFGPKISYVSFFHAWQKGTLNNAPIFLEVKNIENCEKSIKALEKLNFIPKGLQCE